MNKYPQKKKDISRRILERRCNPVIGEKEIDCIEKSDIDQIFQSRSVFSLCDKEIQRTFLLLQQIFQELVEQKRITQDPTSHLYSAVIYAHEYSILHTECVVKFTSRSLFVEISCVWLKSKNYSKVTYDLYLHFLTAYIHPFIGKQEIARIDQDNIRKVYRYFNTVATNETWIGQIHLVLRMVFEYAIEKGLIQSNPILKIDDPKCKPIVSLDRKMKKEVRAAFKQYGFRKDHLVDLARELYTILHVEERKEEEKHPNNEGKSEDAGFSNPITFEDVFQSWHTYTREGVVSDGTAKMNLVNANIYTD